MEDRGSRIEDGGMEDGGMEYIMYNNDRISLLSKIS